MPQAALGLLQLELLASLGRHLLVSMPQAALGLLQLDEKLETKEELLRFNAASGTRTVATARLMEPRPTRAESVRLKKTPQKCRKRQNLAWTSV